MLLGLEMQLRIAEVYGLTWDNIDFENRMISVEKQMLRTDSSFTCGPLKTSEAKRKIHMTDRVYDYLVEHKNNLEYYDYSPQTGYTLKPGYKDVCTAYYCRQDKKHICYDRLALLKCFQNLGHNRASVVADHYL